MLYAKNILKKAGKTTKEFLAWLEDARHDHKIEGLDGVNAIRTERNGGSANEIYIHEALEEKLMEFVNK